jgi:hypothetical protein
MSQIPPRLTQLNSTKMSLTPEEIKIIEFGKAQGKSKDETISALAKYRQTTQATSPTPSTPKTFTEKAGEFSTGFAKGILDTTIGTAQLLQGGGQRVLAGIDPTKNLEQVKATIGFPSLQGEEASRQREMLKADGDYEKAGKITQFAAEMLWPVGRTTEVAGLVNKGKKALEPVVEKVGANFDNFIERIQSIPDTAVGEGGIKIKDRLVELATKLDDKTKTALQRSTRQEFESMVEIGERAMKDDRAITPIEAVGQKFLEGAKSVQNRLNQIGKQKRTVLEQAKNAQQDVSDLVKEATLKIYKGAKSLGPDDKKYAQEIIDRLKPYIKGGRLKDVDALIDDIQDGLYKLADSEKAVQLTNRVTGLIRNSIEGMNKQLQQRVGGSYAELNKQYSELYKILQDVNRGVGKKGERVGAYMKRFFSPSDAGTKKQFEKMQELTGIDFAKETRLAKFVMEALGDRRVESILEQIPKVPSQIIDKFVDYVTKQTGIKDPVEAARIFLQKQGK